MSADIYHTYSFIHTRFLPLFDKKFLENFSVVLLIVLTCSLFFYY